MAQLKNTSIDDTGFLKLPAGTTAQQPELASAGQIRYNINSNVVEWYDETYTRWFPAGFIATIATGGTVTDITQNGITYRVHSFTSAGNSTFSVTRGGLVEYLIVAGGGGGMDMGGGGGYGGTGRQSSRGGNGGSGIVVVRYRIS
jgi:hypothetical protein